MSSDSIWYPPTQNTDAESKPAQGGGAKTQALLTGSAAIGNVATGTHDRNQAIQYSPSDHNQPAHPCNARPSSSANIMPDIDVPTSEFPGFALIDVDRYAELARNIQKDGFLPLIDAGFEDERVSGSTLSKYLEEEKIFA